VIAVRPEASPDARHGRIDLPEIFAVAAGLFLGLTLMKFGNPPIFDSMVERPGTALELFIQPWPIAWGYALLGGVALVGLFVVRGAPSVPRWPWLLPLAWFGWQLLSATGTVDARLTRIVLAHFAALVAGFYLGLFALARARRPLFFWAGLLVGFVFVLWSGLEQHYGGLEATRRYIQSQPDWQNLPPEQLKRVASNRIFATLLYPNVLAGVLLLLVPALVVAVWQLAAGWPRLLRLLATTLLAWAGLALSQQFSTVIQ